MSLNGEAKLLLSRVYIYAACERRTNTHTKTHTHDICMTAYKRKANNYNAYIMCLMKCVSVEGSAAMAFDALSWASVYIHVVFLDLNAYIQFKAQWPHRYPCWHDPGKAGKENRCVCMWLFRAVVRGMIKHTSKVGGDPEVIPIPEVKLIKMNSYFGV